MRLTCYDCSKDFVGHYMLDICPGCHRAANERVEKAEARTKELEASIDKMLGAPQCWHLPLWARAVLVGLARGQADTVKEAIETMPTEMPTPSVSERCLGVPGNASWHRCEKQKGHDGQCTHDPAPRPSEALLNPGVRVRLIGVPDALGTIDGWCGASAVTVQWDAGHRNVIMAAALERCPNDAMRELALKAVASQEARKGEDIGEWAKRLAADSVAAGEAEYGARPDKAKDWKPIGKLDQHRTNCLVADYQNTNLDIGLEETIQNAYRFGHCDGQRACSETAGPDDIFDEWTVEQCARTIEALPSNASDYTKELTRAMAEKIRRLVSPTGSEDPR